MNLLITGATGFVGSRLVDVALDKQYNVSAVTRSAALPNQESNYNLQWCIGNLSSEFDWSKNLTGIDCVIHCAARVHQMQDDAQDIQAVYDQTNFHGTLNLAKQAVANGVKRFIFISSIKVNGEQTEVGTAFQPIVNHPPRDPYGISKYKAEQALLSLAEETGLEVVIIRPPLVYGPGVKANFQSMMKWVSRSMPLPLGAINNQRSMVYLDNLVDLILLCIEHPNAVNQIFLVSDDHDISTSQLLRKINQLSNAHCLLLPIPMSWFQVIASVMNKPQIAQRLCGSLQVDITHTQKQLNWQPPVSWEQGTLETVTDYLSNKK
ncbi:UDP-glucose 4-epimerase family protein [Vibrio casei]|uniref:NAD-dependent epimerase/dehydratase family protein n=1 Tax=Vibrio casei TaxID=673372 RepID=A0A368LG25_9VIBR|nr:SDR family oxidoreductase [Vibrio casei]RCS69131.1 NAD-dependent epimerase/dehydratase family protein [Vibrio casei]SJN37331.1 UDP-glucose 4-epimerase [Vibrio casei]